jgi:hypothetical protein
VDADSAAGECTGGNRPYGGHHRYSDGCYGRGRAQGHCYGYRPGHPRGDHQLRWRLHRWQAAGILTAQTGSPFTVNLAASESGSAIVAFGNPYRPDLIANPYTPLMANPNPACHETIAQGGLAADAVDQSGSWFNTCAFVQPPAGQFGNAGRNILTGPGLRNLDLSLSRSIPLRGDKYHPQFRGEFFNMLDHPNFDIPNYVFGDPTFGEVLSANAYGNKPPRQIQLGLKYVF